MAKRKIKSDLHMMIKDIKLPILTLDNQWHTLFTEDQKTERIRELELKVNNLLKRQGKLINDIDDMKKLKKKLINDIMMNMDVKNSTVVDKKKEKILEKNKEYINEINDKIDKAMDELGDIPYQIRNANAELVSESMQTLYELMLKRKEQLTDITERIDKMREELKQMIVKKQDLEANYTNIYTYMHDLLGGEVMNILDNEYKHIANN